MTYQSLLNKNKEVTKEKKPKKSKYGLGCEGCPLNKPSKNKVINIKRIKGKPLSVWAQAPGFVENEKGIELKGPAGKFFWKYMHKVGLSRKDCDIQNVVRCRPTKKNEYGRVVDRAPDKEELHHCSYWTEKALPKIKAKVYIVLGAVAAQQLLGKELNKTKKIFWSEKLDAKVICIDHPSYFLRGDAPASRLKEFIAGIELAAQLIKGKIVDKWQFIKQQNYGAITKGSTAKKYEKEIYKAAKKGYRITADIESGVINGKKVIVCIGFCYQYGYARSMFLHHPEVKYDPVVKKVVKRLLESDKIKLVFHYGASDSADLLELEGIKVNRKAYVFDTNFSEFMRFSNRKSYALGEIAQARYPQFAGYKEIHWPWTKNGTEMNMANVPKYWLAMYNCADCDLSKRAQISVEKYVPLPLVKVYTYASHVLFDMEKRGPKFDNKFFPKVFEIVSKRVEKLKEKLQMLAGDPEFNPNTPAEVAHVMYKVLKIKKIELKGEVQDGTKAEVLGILAMKHEFPRLELEYRQLAKLKSTYLEGFQNCAKLHNWELRTRWWLTGAGTGRMSSGGGKEREDVVNFQNIHRNPIVKNLLISDRRWRDVL